ncbi:MAG: UDP-N-acetylmuramate dehydrogenase [Patescibacteria group bacterium]|nr:UDP-N-acetylmuramate dehydrogenase [Patescibacteria group bacterium]
METLFQQFLSHFPQFNFKQNYPLSKLTYFKIGGPAEVLVRIQEKNAFVDLIRFCREKSIKFTILGGGSNVVIADQGLSGLVIIPEHEHLLEISANNQGKVIRVDSGISMGKLINQTINLGLAGLEPFYSIPGKLGGAIYTNAHYQGVLIGDLVLQVEVLNLQNEVQIVDQKDCQFQYDFSRFQKTGEIILSADFKLVLGDKQKSREKIKEYTQHRAQTQPLDLPSSGCIFKNLLNNDDLKQLFPQFAKKEYVPAGFLIDQAGLKGLKENDVEVSQKHAAFFVNQGEGTACDVKQLVKKVKAVVKDKFNVKLEEEIFYLQ